MLTCSPLYIFNTFAHMIPISGKKKHLTPGTGPSGRCSHLNTAYRPICPGPRSRYPVCQWAIMPRAISMSASLPVVRANLATSAG